MPVPSKNCANAEEIFIGDEHSGRFPEPFLGPQASFEERCGASRWSSCRGVVKKHGGKGSKAECFVKFGVHGGVRLHMVELYWTLGAFVATPCGFHDRCGYVIARLAPGCP